MTGNDMGASSDMLDPPDLTGTKFVFTGQMERITRAEAIQAVKDRGGQVVGAPVSGTTHLVCGPESFSARKIGTAEKLGLTILNETAFLDLVRMQRD